MKIVNIALLIAAVQTVFPEENYKQTTVEYREKFDAETRARNAIVVKPLAVLIEDGNSEFTVLISVANITDGEIFLEKYAGQYEVIQQKNSDGLVEKQFIGGVNVSSGRSRQNLFENLKSARNIDAKSGVSAHAFSQVVVKINKSILKTTVSELALKTKLRWFDVQSGKWFEAPAKVVAKKIARNGESVR